MKEITRGSLCNIHTYNWSNYMLVRQTKSKWPPCNKSENDGNCLLIYYVWYNYMGSDLNTN